MEIHELEGEEYSHILDIGNNQLLVGQPNKLLIYSGKTLKLIKKIRHQHGDLRNIILVDPETAYLAFERKLVKFEINYLTIREIFHSLFKTRTIQILPNERMLFGSSVNLNVLDFGLMTIISDVELPAGLTDINHIMKISDDERYAVCT